MRFFFDFFCPSSDIYNMKRAKYILLALMIPLLGVTLDEVETRWIGMEQLEGSFVQTSETPLGDEQLEGSLIMSKPNVLLETGEDNMLFRSDSLFIWSDGATEGMAVAAPPIFSGNIFDMLRNSYEITLEDSILTGHAENEESVLSFEIVLNTKTLLPRSIKLNRLDGTTTLFTISNLSEKCPTPDKLHRPTEVDFIR